MRFKGTVNLKFITLLTTPFKCLRHGYLHIAYDYLKCQIWLSIPYLIHYLKNLYTFPYNHALFVILKILTKTHLIKNRLKINGISQRLAKSKHFNSLLISSDYKHERHIHNFFFVSLFFSDPEVFFGSKYKNVNIEKIEMDCEKQKYKEWEKYV